MRVFLCKLDVPENPHEWWFRDKEVKTLDDFIDNFAGVEAMQSWGEVYDIRDDDDKGLIEKCKQHIGDNHITPPRHIIHILCLYAGVRCR